MQKNVFTIFNFKVTAGANILNIWPFLLYHLNCWSICNQTWFDSTASEAGVPCRKNWWLSSRSSHSEGSLCQWMFVQMMSSEPQNILLSNLVWLCSIMSQSVVQKNWFSVFKVRVTARAYIIKIWLFLQYLNDSFCYIFGTAVPIAIKLGLIVQHCKLECVEKLDYCIYGQGHSEGSICQWMTVWYLLISRIFCYQTWYGDAAWWAIMSFRGKKKLFAIFKVKVTARAHITEMWLSAIISELLIAW